MCMLPIPVMACHDSHDGGGVRKEQHKRKPQEGGEGGWEFPANKTDREGYREAPELVEGGSMGRSGTRGNRRKAGREADVCREGAAAPAGTKGWARPHVSCSSGLRDALQTDRAGYRQPPNLAEAGNSRSLFQTREGAEPQKNNVLLAFSAQVVRPRRCSMSDRGG